MAKSLADLILVLFLVKRSVQSETGVGSNIQYLNVLILDTTIYRIIPSSGQEQARGKWPMKYLVYSKIILITVARQINISEGSILFILFYRNVSELIK
jgi:thermostable 8-oxoguanine DNA glycosylase